MLIARFLTWSAGSFGAFDVPGTFLRGLSMILLLTLLDATVLYSLSKAARLTFRREGEFAKRVRALTGLTR